MIRLLFRISFVLATLLLAGCAGMNFSGAAAHVGGHNVGAIGVSGTVPGAVHQAPVVVPGRIHAWPSQGGVVPVCRPPVNPPGTIPGFHPGLNKEVCAFPGDPNVIFNRGVVPGVPHVVHPGIHPHVHHGVPPVVQPGLIHHQGCRPPYVPAYRRADGVQVCAHPNDGTAVFPGRKDPFNPYVCRSGARMMGGQYICMDSSSLDDKETKEGVAYTFPTDDQLEVLAKAN